jgi:hypothetical protein
LVQKSHQHVVLPAISSKIEELCVREVCAGVGKGVPNSVVVFLIPVFFLVDVTMCAWTV